MAPVRTASAQGHVRNILSVKLIMDKRVVLFCVVMVQESKSWKPWLDQIFVKSRTISQ